MKTPTCDLIHKTPPEAVNVLMQLFAGKGGSAEVQIFICQECQDALLGEKWQLFYCIGCCRSAWRVTGRLDLFDNSKNTVAQ